MMHTLQNATNYSLDAFGRYTELRLKLEALTVRLLRARPLVQIICKLSCHLAVENPGHLTRTTNLLPL